jgi:hypothetical protein
MKSCSAADPLRRGVVGACLLFALAVLPAATSAAVPAPSDPRLREEAAAALKRATTYFRTHAAARGGYVYYSSLDFQQRWGEGVATPDQIFVEPPGTPAVGLAYLKAYAATGDRIHLDAAVAAGRALIFGQLESGGWSQRIDFNPQGTHAIAKAAGNRTASTTPRSTTIKRSPRSSFWRASIGCWTSRMRRSTRRCGMRSMACGRRSFPTGPFPRGGRGRCRRIP